MAAGGTVDFSAPAASFSPATTLEGLVAQGQDLDFINKLDENEDLRSLKQITVYGLRGLAAYADHAAILARKMSLSMLTFMKPWRNSPKAARALSNWLAWR